jgi:hypothetical protein
MEAAGDIANAHKPATNLITPEPGKKVRKAVTAPASNSNPHRPPGEPAVSLGSRVKKRKALTAPPVDRMNAHAPPITSSYRNHRSHGSIK